MNRDQSSNFRLRRFKRVSLLCALVNTELCILNTAQAKDLGTHGIIYAIEEEDPITLIQQKLKAMEESGELAERNLELQKKTRGSAERPKSVKGITKATKDHVFYYDPTYVVKEDLYDHQGKIFAKKGMKINPLATVSLSAHLVFFDGDDPDQVMWVKEKLSQHSPSSRADQTSEHYKNTPSLKLILIKGAPLKLAEDFGMPVYFDQEGTLTKKLGIKHVPAMVSQEGNQLKIEEIKVPPSGELGTERGA